MKKNRKFILIVIGCFLFLYVVWQIAMAYFFQTEKVVVSVDSATPKMVKYIYAKNFHPYAMDGSSRYYWNDTIILNGFKRPPIDTFYPGGHPSDFYDDTIKFSYDPYKATDVEIKVEFIFFGTRNSSY